MSSIDPSPPEPRAIRPPIRLGLLVPGMVLMSVAVGLGILQAARSEPSPPSVTAPMLELAPGGEIDPADVPAALAVHYRAAEAHAGLFAQIPCFCGCAEMLGHRHLLDCFVRPGGGGWEAHAAGCGVCLGEAAQIGDLLAAGETDAAAVREAVVARWGDPYTD